jgi:sulfite reductase (NADPH) flavoprotein alpha-component
MEVAIKTMDGLPSHPLDNLQLTRLQQAAEGLNHQQLAWASGYLAGLGAMQPGAKEAAKQVTTMTILYATQGGNARSVAEALAENARARGFKPRLVSTDSYHPRDLSKERLLVAVISTQGEGEPPESAYELFHYLQSNKPSQLTNLHYAIFGLGDSSYEHFCEAGKTLDRLLKSRGARALVERIDADVDYQQLSSTWQERILQSVSKVQHSEQARIIPLQRYEAVRYDRNKPFKAELLERRRITTDNALSEVHHLVLQVDPAAIHYHPGDALGLFFRNDPALIEEILSHTGLAGETRVFQGKDALTLVEALTERLELTQLHPNVVKAWASLAGHADLNNIIQDGERLRHFLRDRQFVDLLIDYPAEVNGQVLVELLHSQQPRLYSIASSQKVCEDEIHLTVSTLRWQSREREYLGGASGYLTQGITEGDPVGVYVVENPSFKLPKSTDTPIIMIGAGTGIAPYRAFLQEREALGSSGDNWLVFGNRHFHRDFLYQTDWLNYRKSGLLKRISLAFSRDRRERTYVQTRLNEERIELYRWLQEGAHLYVCGGVEMEQDVRLSLLEIVQDQGGQDEQTAAEYIESLRQQGRYQRDVY